MQVTRLHRHVFTVRSEDEKNLQEVIEIFKAWCDQHIDDTRKQYGYLRNNPNTTTFFINTDEEINDILLLDLTLYFDDCLLDIEGTENR